MSNRTCMACGRALPGRRGHGHVIRGKLLCGRREIERTVTGKDGAPSLELVATPECHGKRTSAS